MKAAVKEVLCFLRLQLNSSTVKAILKHSKWTSSPQPVLWSGSLGTSKFLWPSLWSYEIIIRRKPTPNQCISTPGPKPSRQQQPWCADKTWKNPSVPSVTIVQLLVLFSRHHPSVSTPGGKYALPAAKLQKRWTRRKRSDFRIWRSFFKYKFSWKLEM